MAEGRTGRAEESKEAYVRNRGLTTLGTWLLLAGSGAADDKLALLIPGVFGPSGLFVDSEARLPSGDTHSAHFNSAFQSEFHQFNVALASQITSLPAPSPASGFAYTFDSSLGLFTRSTDSFGPLFSERALTAGDDKLTLGFAFQHFTFDTIDDVDLGGIPAVFTHDNPAPGGRDDVVATQNAIEASVSQFTLFLNYGLTDRLDVAVAAPFLSAELAVTAHAKVNRIGTAGNPLVHFFRDEAGGVGDERVYHTSSTASGVGDISLRLKGRVAEVGSSAFALGAELRFPTGDEEDLLGSGAWGAKPFVVFSSSHRRVSVHLNLGYQWNGESVLAGDVAEGEKAEFPDQLFYSGSVTFAVSPKLTLVADLLGRRFLDAPRLVKDDFLALDGVTTMPDVHFGNESFNQTTGSFGLRFNTVGGLLVNLNVLVALDTEGLRDEVTPLVGVEYGF